jgi:hypothetical protein
MPTANDILLSLKFLANKYDELSIAWHVVIVFGLIAAVYNKRIKTRFYLGVCGLLFLSVSTMAATVNNIFNLVVFLGLSIVFLRELLIANSYQFLTTQAGIILSAYFLILAGLIYPHFFGSNFFRYLIAAPVGIIPCPTLLVTSGLTLLFKTSSTRLNYFLIAANLFYGVIGVFFLGVTLDVILLLAVIIQVFQSKLNISYFKFNRQS